MFIPTITALLFFVSSVMAADTLERDIIKTSAGDLEIAFIRHGSLMIKFGGKVIHVDPYGQVGDYGKLAKADMILITHEHGDHFDQKAIEQIKKDGTIFVITKKCRDKVKEGNVVVMENGDAKTVMGITIEAVPAYNIVHKRQDGTPFHPKGEGNGYVLNVAEKRIYIAGDTENIPEMKALRNIDVAFLPMNLPYTMTPEMVADAARTIKPKILYPYHYGETDTSKIVSVLKDMPEIEVRIRNMK